VKQRLYGVVVEATKNHKYKVQFDNGTVKECISNTLRVENTNANIPVDELHALSSGTFTPTFSRGPSDSTAATSYASVREPTAVTGADKSSTSTPPRGSSDSTAATSYASTREPTTVTCADESSTSTPPRGARESIAVTSYTSAREPTAVTGADESSTSTAT